MIFTIVIFGFFRTLKMDKVDAGNHIANTPIETMQTLPRNSESPPHIGNPMENAPNAILHVWEAHQSASARRRAALMSEVVNAI